MSLLRKILLIAIVGLCAGNVEETTSLTASPTDITNIDEIETLIRQNFDTIRDVETTLSSLTTLLTSAEAQQRKYIDKVNQVIARIENKIYLLTASPKYTADERTSSQFAKAETTRKEIESLQLHLKRIKAILKEFMKKNNIVPFRIGFEFQMGGEVLPWTNTESYEIQKTPIFEMHYLGRKLWHIEIDGKDIEFVTEPFSYSERDLLIQCMHSIDVALNNLEIFDKPDGVTFSEWLSKIEDSSLCSTGNYFVYSTPFFEQVASKKIQKNLLRDKGEPFGGFNFMPQVTIQFPLKYAVDICYSLLYSPSNSSKLASALPLKDNFNSTINFCRTDVGGLIFLQALTMLDMTYGIPRSDKEKDKAEVDNIHTLCKQQYQFDAKRKIFCMSRRPFSEMLKDIKSTIEPSLSYIEIFETHMQRNPFFRKLNVKEFLPKSDYAEQFFCHECPRDLSKYTSFLNEEFYTRYKEQLDYLLQQGIVSTQMLRNSTITSFFGEDYYERILQSIERPTTRPQLIFDGDKLNIIDKPWHYDLLSPPFPLENGVHKQKTSRHLDAMGAYNLPSQEYRTSEYGTAIVEFRRIKPYERNPFLKGVIDIEDDTSSEFLSYQQHLPKQALALFDHISHIDNNGVLPYTETVILNIVRK